MQEAFLSHDMCGIVEWYIIDPSHVGRSFLSSGKGTCIDDFLDHHHHHAQCSRLFKHSARPASPHAFEAMPF